MCLPQGHSSFKRKFDAWMLHAVEDFNHKHYGKLKQLMFESLLDSVVELGPGLGSHFRYYRRGTSVIAIEPNFMLHSLLRKNAEKYGINLDIHGVKAEELNLADESVEAVASSLVLCSVNQRRVLGEVYRILKPGGRLMLLEHVAAPDGTFLRLIQNMIRQPWEWLYDGCQLNCDTVAVLKETGFSKIALDHFELKLPFFIPIVHHITGAAMK